GWRVSLRSADAAVDVARLCQRYGGGGHPRAAGCRLPPGASARRLFLDELRHRVAELLAEGSPAGR
ncbi:MAG: DHHA1 domain-containing protein, partial [Thermomicrobium sp.]|nr:DHHA1 domain-containing protein [Thermomicrobium sp.]